MAASIEVRSMRNKEDPDAAWQTKSIHGYSWPDLRLSYHY